MVSKKKQAEPRPEPKVHLSKPVWTGSISFGLVNIPVELYMGVRRKDVRFHLLHEKDKARLQQRLICPAEDKEVPRDEVVKGYEVATGQHVVVTPAEMESLAPKASRTIELVNFVDAGSIDPLYFDRPYYVMPGERGAKAYQLLLEALKAARKAAVGRFVMRNKEYIGILRPIKSLLCLETMHFADEVILADQIAWEPPPVKVSDAERKMAEQLVDTLSSRFEPDRFHDDYREALQQLIEKKAEGQEIVTAPAAAEEGGPEVINLMAALEKSLTEVKRHRPSRVA